MIGDAVTCFHAKVRRTLHMVWKLFVSFDMRYSCHWGGYRKDVSPHRSKGAGAKKQPSAIAF